MWQDLLDWFSGHPGVVGGIPILVAIVAFIVMLVAVDAVRSR
jgi:hypothetical protein